MGGRTYQSVAPLASDLTFSLFSPATRPRTRSTNNQRRGVYRQEVGSKDHQGGIHRRFYIFNQVYVSPA